MDLNSDQIVKALWYTLQGFVYCGVAFTVLAFLFFNVR